jgi:hypothetical protein
LNDEIVRVAHAKPSGLACTVGVDHAQDPNGTTCHQRSPPDPRSRAR